MQSIPETIAKTIPLAMIVELRTSHQRHGLKSREDYDKAKKNFIVTKNPGQKQQQARTAAHPATVMTDIMADTTVKIFYGDYSRSDKDPTSWMQNLNTRKVANDWMDTRIISVFESLLAEEKGIPMVAQGPEDS